MPDILNLPFYKATEVRENDDNYLIFACTTIPPTSCPSCHALDYRKHGARESLFMDIPIHGKRVGIQLVRQRYRCRACNNVFIDPLTGMDEKRAMTSRLVRFIETEAFKRAFTDIADDIGVVEGTIRSVFHDVIKRLNAAYQVETPDWLGIDEIHLLGSPRCVLTNVRARTLIDMLKTRNKPVVERYLLSLPDRRKIQVVTMDMWSPYKEAVEGTIPQAKIVVDHFHVIKMANKCLDDLRKSLKMGMTTSQKRQLMRDRYVLLKRKKDLQPKDVLLLDTWLGNIPQLDTAYKLKEIFFEIYDFTDKKEAEERYTAWCDTLSANPEIEPYFSDLVRAMTNWHDEIFNYFDFRITNGYTEAFNSLIALTNHIGRGYSFEVLRAKMLFRNGKHKPTFRDSALHQYQVGQQPDIQTSEPYQGMPITTLTEVIAHNQL